MSRILSCFTNCYGAAGRLDGRRADPRGRHRPPGAGPARPRLRRPGDPRVGRHHREGRRRHGPGVRATTLASTGSRSAAATSAGPTSGPREGVELTERRIRFAGRWFGVPVVVSGAGQPADAGRAPDRRRPPAPARRHGRRARHHRRPGDPQGADPERRGHARPDGRGRPSPRPAQLRHRQHRLLQPGRRPRATSSRRSSTWSATST